MSITETMDRHLKALDFSCCALSCATNLILLIVKLSVDLGDNEWSFLNACFSPTVSIDSYQGWEEKVNVSLIYLLKNCLGKGDNETKFPEIQLEPLKDITKLKKHITLVLDKIMKNAPFNLEDSYMAVARTNSSELEDLTLPEGCKYVGKTDSNPPSPQPTLDEDVSNGNVEETQYMEEESDNSKIFDGDEEMII